MSINKKILLYLSRFAEVYPIGHSKYAPGTMGSLIGVLIGCFLILNLDVKFYLIFLLIFIIVSYLLCEAHLKFYNKKDPKEVVVDEVRQRSRAPPPRSRRSPTLRPNSRSSAATGPRASAPTFRLARYSRARRHRQR